MKQVWKFIRLCLAGALGLLFIARFLTGGLASILASPMASLVWLAIIYALVRWDKPLNKHNEADVAKSNQDNQPST